MDTPLVYLTEVLGMHTSAIHRQLWEALEIATYPDDQIINTRKEWGMNPIPRNTTMFLDKEVQEGTDSGPLGSYQRLNEDPGSAMDDQISGQRHKAK